MGRLDPVSPEGQFAAALDDADGAAEMLAIKAWCAHFETDWRACAEFLARRFSERWARRSGFEVAAATKALEPTIEERAARLLEDLARFQRESRDFPSLDKSDPPCR